MHSSRTKRSLVVILCAAMLVSMLPAAGSEAFPFIAYTTDSLRLRQQADATSTVLLVIPKGNAVEVTGADGSYYIVSFEGSVGYALKSFVTRTAPPQAAAVETPAPVSTEIADKYPPLSVGAEGQAVKVLQEALKELAFHRGAIDGKFGPATAEAVKRFQEANKLPDSAMADSATQQLLFEGRPRNAAGRQASVKTLPAIGGLTLRPGDRGDQVRELQQALREKGYYKGTLDGIYGRGTEQAVRDFQRASKLKVDGKAGPNTLSALYSTPEQQLPPTESQPSAPEVTPAPAFVEASEAPATYPYTTTASAAVNLRKRAATSSARILTVPSGATIEVLAVSGDFLQAKYNTHTGYVMADYINVPEQYLPGKALPFNSDARVNYEALSVGASGHKVRALQRALEELGFFKGQADGSFGPATLSALKAFQEKNNLRATGIALPELQQLLYEKRPRNAAGRRVTLKQLPPIPGYPMETGDVGEAVAALHRSLQTLGHYKGDISETYSRATADAVKAFQKAHSIRQTGKVDNFTTLALNAAIGVNLATPAPIVDTGTVPPALTEQNVIVMRSGTRGVQVTRLQTRLVELGYYQIAPDGVYDAKDVAAVKAFQMNNGLLVNGIADLATQQAMYAATALPKGQTADGFVPPVEVPASYETLRIGSSGDAVRALQTRLISLSFLTGNADGIFGTQTAKAVTSFQRNNNLRADGVAGTDTLTALYGAKAVGSQAPLNPSAEEDAPASRGTLRAGDSGSDVKAMQQKLIELKYLTGGADGVFGPKTYLALQAFQSNNKLNQDGLAGSLTLAKLYSVGAVPATGMAALPTPTPAPEVPAAPVFTAPRAAEVRFADWAGEIRARTRSMPNIIIYDFISGAHYNVKLFSVGRHADGEPPTKQDTETMERALGYNNWDPRPVWVIFSDGRVYMGSTHSHGHEVDHNPNNGLTGHICVHFPRPMADAEATGPYAVAHQQAILAGWDLTQSLASR